ncbi:MAG: homoserine dehydrogenase [Candidatus Omnitrophica bacterium]|nr:homoserine dehydrogenase [Candidatus Omnitrophota bacterium]
MKRINVGLIGAGTVGKGVIRILKERKAMLREKLGVEIFLKRACDKEAGAFNSLNLPREMITRRAEDIISDPQIDIVVELIGGINPAKDLIRDSLKSGKYVVTANKALLSDCGAELFALAKAKDKSIYFEASVCAGVPVIKSIREGLVANRFNSVYGIVNGTSNYILSRMSQERISFAEALKEAKKKGYAEKDPSLDINGVDSAHKLVLLAYLAFGRFISLGEVFIEGISKISSADIEYAKDMDLEIKLLAIAKKQGSQLEVRVHPTLIPREHPLASISGVDNAIYLSCDLVGNLLFHGPGAGQLSAASAVVSDLVDLSKDIKAGMFRSSINVIPDRGIVSIKKIDEIESRYYIRVMVLDKPGVLATISGVLGRHNISIASVSQKERRRAEFVPIVMITHEAREKDMRMASEKINKLPQARGGLVAIRIEEL